MGPGTGLGNSVLFPIRENEIIVIPSEGGHIDFPLIDE
jgi:glucokinase